MLGEIRPRSTWVIPMGTRVMCSKPPTSTMSAKFMAISMNPIWMPAMDEPHCWSTNLAGIVLGRFAMKIGIRPP